MIKNLYLIFSIVGITTGSVNADAPTDRLHFPASGFTIAPLESTPENSTQQPLIMCLPVADGFAANVNVQIQPYTGTIEEYLALSLQQIKSSGFKLKQQKKSTPFVVIFEYTGEAKNQKFHWYAKAEKSGGSVYLATATTIDALWEKQMTVLKSCVDSFHCDSVTRREAVAPKK